MINVQNIERHLTLNTINDSRVDIHKHTQRNEQSNICSHIRLPTLSHTTDETVSSRRIPSEGCFRFM